MVMANYLSFPLHAILTLNESLTRAADPVSPRADPCVGARPVLALLGGVAGAVAVAGPQAGVVGEADHAEQVHCTGN